MAATLTKAMLDKVFKGISHIYVVEPKTITATTFDGADEIFTLKDSVTFSQAQPTKTEINVDQFTAPIAATYEAGEFSIAATVPSVAKEVLEYFYTKNATAVTPITGFASGVAIDLANKVINVSLKMVNDSGDMAVVIPRCEIIANMDWSDTSTSAFGQALTITPKVNPDNTGDVLFYYKS